MVKARRLELRFVSVLILLLCAACGTSDSGRLKAAREEYLKDNFTGAEAALFTPEVYQNDQNRLMHYYLLSSVAMSEGLYEKAAFFLNKARDTAISVRSANGSFDWFSSAYRSNPIEFSYIHYMLVMSYALLAQDGRTPAWGTPEIKNEKGVVLVQAQNVPVRVYDARESAEYATKARAELRAWDVHLETLRRTYPNDNFYKEDVWARTLAGFVHALSNDHNEKRTAELLTNDARKILDHVSAIYPTEKNNEPAIDSLLDQLKDRAKSKESDGNLLIVEAGVMQKYKIKRFMLGLSTVFSHISDPHLRSMMEQLGMQVIIQNAPEFGLILLGGGLAGAMDSGDEFDGPPRYFTDAVDRSFGFEIRFPSMPLPPADTKVTLHLSQQGKALSDVPLPILSPIEELLAVELKNREDGEMFSKALKIGTEYVAILVPAIVAYRQATREDNVFKKLAILAGYFIAKKAIDHANNPDLRSWDFLPNLIAASYLKLAPGAYQAQVEFNNSFGRDTRDLGVLSLGSPSIPLIRKRIGEVPILKAR